MRLIKTFILKKKKKLRSAIQDLVNPLLLYLVLSTTENSVDHYQVIWKRMRCRRQTCFAWGTEIETYWKTYLVISNMMNKTGFHPYMVVTASLLHSQGSCDAAGSAIPTEGMLTLLG